MQIAIDLDGVVCPDMHERFREARPRDDIIHYINKLYDMGHVINIWTSRGVIENSEGKALEDTISILDAWGLKYSKVSIKPFYDILVDDKALNSVDTLIKMFEKFEKMKFYAEDRL